MTLDISSLFAILVPTIGASLAVGYHLGTRYSVIEALLKELISSHGVTRGNAEIARREISAVREQLFEEKLVRDAD